MTSNELIKILGSWNFWDKDQNSGVLRPLYLEKFAKIFLLEQVIVVTGARRAGKSYLLKQFANQLFSQGYEKKDILLVNFEDPGLAGNLDVDLLEKILQTFISYQKPRQKPCLFLDEIQNVAGWEKWVRTIHEQNKANLVISGSNSKLLSQELSSLLTGRHLDITVFPLSFSEFLSFKSQNADFREYLNFGGFPKVVLENEKTELLLSYFNDILERDVIKRYRIRKGEKIKSLGKFLLGNLGSPVSYRSLERSLEISQETAEKFMGYLENSFLTFLVKRFSFKTKEQERSPRKIYALDGGLANVVGFRFSENLGHLAENLVAGGLLRAKYRDQNFDFFYWKDERENEVDFLLKNGQEISEAIQVCWDFTTEKTREREIKALVRGMRVFGLKQGTILTAGEEGKIKVDDLQINISPLASSKYVLD